IPIQPSPTPTPTPSSTPQPSTSTKPFIPRPITPQASQPDSGSNPTNQVPPTPDGLNVIFGTFIKNAATFAGSLTPQQTFVAPNSIILLLVIIALFYLYASWTEHRIQTKTELILGHYKKTKQLRSDFINIASHYLNTPLELMRGSIELAQTQHPELHAKLLAVAGSLQLMTKDIRSLLEQSQSLSVATSNTAHTLDSKQVPRLFSNRGVWLPTLVTVILIIAVDVILIATNASARNPYTYGMQLSLLIIGAAFLAFAYRARWRLKTISQSLKNELDYEHDFTESRSAFIQQAQYILAGDIAAIQASTKSLIATGSLPSLGKGMTMLASVSAQLNLISEYSNPEAQPRPAIDLSLALLEDKARLEEYVRSSGMRLDINISPAIKVALSLAQISQLLDSSLHNAIKFSQSGSRMSITLSKKGSRAILSIQDAGQGIDKDRIQHLFEPFSRGTDVLQYNFEGVGLNIYINKLMVEQLGGKAAIVSKSNEGTTVTYTIPLSQ
ncbi:MAG: ATP-binding protein, partial [Candidatus Saccharibacteria bacterium]